MYIQDEYLDKLPAPTEDELDMLDLADKPQHKSDLTLTSTLTINLMLDIAG